MKKIEEYNEVLKTNNEEMTLVRDFSDQFFRIWRKSYNGKNANYEDHSRKTDSLGNLMTPDYFNNLIEKLKDNNFRLSPKSDKDKTKITDEPGFGSTRLSPPFEDPTFDSDFFNL